MIIVVVRSPGGRDIFVNGDYEAPRARSGEEMGLRPGAHKFETLTPDLKVDFRLEINSPDKKILTLDLQPVVPPQPTAGAGGES